MARRYRLLSILLAILSLIVLASSGCRPPGGVRGTPRIAGALISFLPDSAPEGFQSAGVSIIDDADGSPVDTATVSVNGTPLVYSAATHYYQGNPIVRPGESVTLHVSAGGKEYWATGQQFRTYPTIVKPEFGERLAYSDGHEITWSTESPAIVSRQCAVAVLDAHDPNGPLVWPNNGLLPIQAGGTSSWIPNDSLGAAECLVIVGAEKPVGIPLASERSVFVIGGFDRVPVTVVSPTGFVSIQVSPQGAVSPVGGSSQYHGVGLRGGMERVDVTSTAEWTSSDPSVATVDNSPGNYGLIHAVAPGTSTITATVGDVSASQALTVSPWMLQESVTTNYLFDVAWSGTQFVAVGMGEVFTSPDGSTWTRHPVSGSGTFYSVIWTGSQFAAVGYLGVWTSPDGSTWTQTCSTDGQGIVWSGSQFVAVGAEILTSPDGVQWTVRDDSPPFRLYDVAWSGSLFVAVGASDKVLTSPDGISWTQRSSGAAEHLTNIASSGAVFVATGSYDVATSTDGVTWTDHPAVPGASQIIWTNTKFVGVGEYSYAESSDGETWTSIPVGWGNLLGIAWNGAQYVVVGSSGTILTSVSQPAESLAKSVTTSAAMATRPGAIESLLRTPEDLRR